MKHYIIYHDKSIEEVSEKVAEVIWSKSGTGARGVEVNGKKYIFSSIFKIRSEEDYFKEYPDRRPYTTPDVTSEEFWKVNQQIRKPTTRAKELMTKGFIQARNEMGESEEDARQKFKDFKLFTIH